MKEQKAARILYIYKQLLANKSVNKQVLADFFGVSKRSIQRDISELIGYLDEQAVYTNEVITYNAKENSYSLSSVQQNNLEIKELVMISKILLESRALIKKEMDQILNKLMAYVDDDEKKLLQNIITNELYHYTELQHKKPLLNQVYDLILAIDSQRKIKLSYKRQDNKIVERTVNPLTIIFSEYYFYLVATWDNSTYGPLIYRVDRIGECMILDDSFKINYANRFEEGLFKKQVQFMYPGALQHIKLKFQGSSAEALLDRLPTANILQQCTNHEGNYFIIEASIYGEGIIMWILSQGDKIEVLEPKLLRQKLSSIINNLYSIYQ